MAKIPRQRMGQNIAIANASGDSFNFHVVQVPFKFWKQFVGITGFGWVVHIVQLSFVFSLMLRGSPRLQAATHGHFSFHVRTLRTGGVAEK